MTPPGAMGAVASNNPTLHPASPPGAPSAAKSEAPTQGPASDPGALGAAKSDAPTGPSTASWPPGRRYCRTPGAGPGIPSRRAKHCCCRRRRGRAPASPPRSPSAAPSDAAAAVMTGPADGAQHRPCSVSITPLSLACARDAEPARACSVGSGEQDWCGSFSASRDGSF